MNEINSQGEVANNRVFVVHAPHGHITTDISLYYADAFRRVGLQTIEFPTHRHLEYHTLSASYLKKIGYTKQDVTVDELLNRIQTQMLGALVRVKPEIVFVIHGFCFEPWFIMNMRELLDSWGGIMVLLATESPFGKEDEIAVSEYFDLTFVTDLTGTEYIEGARYLQHAYHPLIHKPLSLSEVPDMYKVDIGFIGSFFTERITLVEKLMSEGYTTYLAGIVNDFDVSEEVVERIRPVVVSNPELVKLYNGALFSLNINRHSHELYDSTDMGTQKSLTIRMVEVLASGGVLVTNKTEELDSYFVDGEDYISYEDYDELVEKLNYYKNKSLYSLREKGYSKILDFSPTYIDNARVIYAHANSLLGGT